MHLPRRARAAVLGALLSTVAVAGMTGTALAVADDRCGGHRASCAADPAALALVSTTPRTAPNPAPTTCPDPRAATACPSDRAPIPVIGTPGR